MNPTNETQTTSPKFPKTTAKKAKGKKEAATAQAELPAGGAEQGEQKNGKKPKLQDALKDTEQTMWLAIDNKPAVAFLQGQGGGYWSADSKVGVFLVNGEKENGGKGEFLWDGKPAATFPTWGKLCADLLYRNENKPLADLVRAALEEKHGKGLIVTDILIEEQANTDGKFSPAEAVGREMLRAEQGAQEPVQKVEPAQEPKADPPEAPAAPEAPAERPIAKLTDPELKIELEARGVTKIGDLRDLGARLGFGFAAAKAPKASTSTGEKKPGIWAFVLGLMRRDAGVTDAEALKLLGEEFPKHPADSMKSTVSTNISALRMLVGGRGAAGEYTIRVSTDEKRGRVYQIVGATLNKGAKGILNETAKAIMQPSGASESEIVEKLCSAFPDRPKASLKSTVSTQLSMWRSILAEGASEATFSISAGDGGKSVYRVR